MEEIVSNGHLGDVKVALIEGISDAHAAAAYMARVGMDNGLGSFIQTALDESTAYKAWQKAMPNKTPPETSRYQKDISKSDMAAVSQEIDQNGYLLSTGQILFHGGLWPSGKSLTTTRPLSTSMCPQIALRNAEFNAKAYDSARLDLFVLSVTDPKTRAFAFKRKGTTLGHESEVLLAAGAHLTLNSEKLIRSDYRVGKPGCRSKDIPVYVLDISLA